MQLVYVVGALAAGAALAGVAIWAAWRFSRAPPAVEQPVPLEIVFEDHPATVTPARPAPRAAAPPPPTDRRAHPEKAPAMVLTQGAQFRDEHLVRAAPRAYAPPQPMAPPPTIPARSAPAPRPPMREPPPMKSWAQQVMEQAPAEVPTEWARRQVGPVEPGRSAGACGGCGSRLSISSARPLRIACPVCGRTKLLAA